MRLPSPYAWCRPLVLICTLLIALPPQVPAQTPREPDTAPTSERADVLPLTSATPRSQIAPAYLLNPILSHAPGPKVAVPRPLYWTPDQAPRAADRRTVPQSKGEAPGQPGRKRFRNIGLGILGIGLIAGGAFLAGTSQSGGGTEKVCEPMYTGSPGNIYCIIGANGQLVCSGNNSCYFGPNGTIICNSTSVSCHDRAASKVTNNAKVGGGSALIGTGIALVWAGFRKK